MTLARYIICSDSDSPGGILENYRDEELLSGGNVLMNFTVAARTAFILTVFIAFQSVQPNTASAQEMALDYVGRYNCQDLFIVFPKYVGTWVQCTDIFRGHQQRTV